MKSIKIYVVFTTLLAFLFTGILLYINYNSSDTDPLFSTCSPEDFDCVIEKNLEYANEKGIESGLLQIKNYVESPPTSGNESYYFYKGLINDDAQSYGECHYRMHLVGAAYFKEFNANSVIPGFEFCESAYYHGLFTEMGASFSKDMQTFVDEVQSICAEKSKELVDPVPFLSTCVHSVGHAGYIVFRDVDTALDLCSIAYRDYADLSYTLFCSIGVFMELTHSQLNNENLLEYDVPKCLSFDDEQVQLACVGNMIIFFFENGVTLDDACSTFQGDLLNKCAVAYGWKLTISSLDPKRKPELFKGCAATASCLAGVGRGFSTSYFSEEDSRRKCKEFVETYREPGVSPIELVSVCVLGASAALSEIQG